ncbi:hypothetical protein FBZ99_105422 [Rhizobium sp. ERR 1071]|nr:hypothetical protein FBZ99_105422 [Rhizobium sp. ERR1071]
MQLRCGANFSHNFTVYNLFQNTGTACATLLQRTVSIEICQSTPTKSFVGVLKVTDFEEQERQGEILALAKMMQYAGGVASELNASQAVFLINAAQAALLSLLETEFPRLSGEYLNGLVGDARGHC